MGVPEEVGVIEALWLGVPVPVREDDGVPVALAVWLSVEESEALWLDEPVGEGLRVCVGVGLHAVLRAVSLTPPQSRSAAQVPP